MIYFLNDLMNWIDDNIIMVSLVGLAVGVVILTITAPTSMDRKVSAAATARQVHDRRFDYLAERGYIFDRELPTGPSLFCQAQISTYDPVTIFLLAHTPAGDYDCFAECHWQYATTTEWRYIEVSANQAGALGLQCTKELASELHLNSQFNPSIVIQGPER